jgi:hypothetical protein
VAGNPTWIGDFSSMNKLWVHTFLENLDHKSIPISCEISSYGVYIPLQMRVLEIFHDNIMLWQTTQTLLYLKSKLCAYNF